MRRWRQAKALLIDEISMLHPKLLDFLDMMACRSRRGLVQDSHRNSNIMGGIHFICSGDFFQLPPVTRTLQPDIMMSFSQVNKSDNHRHKETRDKFCFQCPTWNKVIQSTILLKSIYRQKDDLFSRCLESLRWGILSGKYQSY